MVCVSVCVSVSLSAGEIDRHVLEWKNLCVRVCVHSCVCACVVKRRVCVYVCVRDCERERKNPAVHSLRSAADGFTLSADTNRSGALPATPASHSATREAASVPATAFLSNHASRQQVPIIAHCSHALRKTSILTLWINNCGLV